MEGFPLILFIPRRKSYVSYNVQPVDELLWEQHAVCKPYRSSVWDVLENPWYRISWPESEAPSRVRNTFARLGRFLFGWLCELLVKAAEKWPNLHLFGYTHRLKSSAIGQSIQVLNGPRSWIRWSDAGGTMSANCPPRKGDIVCPEQLGLTESCLTCMICASPVKSIGFLEH